MSEKYSKISITATGEPGDDRRLRFEIDGVEIKNVLKNETKVVPYLSEQTLKRPGAIVTLSIYTEDLTMDSLVGPRLIIEPGEE